MKIEVKSIDNRQWAMIMPVVEEGDWIIDEAVKELTNYSTARRMSHNTWYWPSQQQAEKFITLFLLKYNK